jgi:hypothetical protein
MANIIIMCLLAVLVGALHRMRVQEHAEFVKVVRLRGPQLAYVRPVERFDVVTDIGDQLGPVMRNGLRELIAIVLQIALMLTEQRSVMEKLFGDAAHIDARATQTPGGARRRRHHEIQNGAFLAKPCLSLESDLD